MKKYTTPSGHFFFDFSHANAESFGNSYSCLVDTVSIQ